MKKFKLEHLFFKDCASNFTEDNPPSWMICREYNWWWIDHVLTLDVGKSIKTDFNRITRIE